MLAAVAADPGLRVSQVDVLEAAERHQVLAGWNDTAVAVGPGMVPELVAGQAARTPDAVAVTCEGELVSYAELAARAGRLAGYLAGLGAGPESVVGVCLPRGAEMVARCWGCGRPGPRTCRLTRACRPGGWGSCWPMPARCAC